MNDQSSLDEILLAVVGVTGSGKSSFIKRVTGNTDIAIGDDLRSMTTEVKAYPFSIQGRNLGLIDTPGFDDGDRTDEDIFESLADWLNQSYIKGQRLNALVYLHRLIANREKGSDLRNLKVFKKLCGEENFDKIVLGITWWDQIDPQTAFAREHMLCDTPEFWGDMVSKGARVERIPHDKVQCIQLLLASAKNESTTLRIQEEMAKGKEPLETTAAKELEQYKAIDAIKDAEESERKAQEVAYDLKNQAIEQRASERRLEQHRRQQEIQMQQISQMASLQTVHRQMVELEPSRRSSGPQMTERDRKMTELQETLRQARLCTQPPKYTVEDRLERMRIVGRSKLYLGEIVAAFKSLEALAEDNKQNWDWICNPCVEGEVALWVGFCDRCLKQASIKGYWQCNECSVETSSGANSSILICNQCKAKGQTCLDRSHTLKQAQPRAENKDINAKFEDQIEFCPRARHISAAIRCNECKATPGPVFLHCRECDKDDFDLCLECFAAGKTCEKKKKHTLLLHSWCPPTQWRRIEKAVSINLK